MRRSITPALERQRRKAKQGSTKLLGLEVLLPDRPFWLESASVELSNVPFWALSELPHLWKLPRGEVVVHRARRRILESCNCRYRAQTPRLCNLRGDVDGPAGQDGADVARPLLTFGVRLQAIRLSLGPDRSW